LIAARGIDPSSIPRSGQCRANIGSGEIIALEQHHVVGRHRERIGKAIADLSVRSNVDYGCHRLTGRS
jgi:hypothetical protein